MNKTILFRTLFFSAFAFLSCNFLAYAETHEARYPLKAIDRPSIMPTGIFSVDFNGKFKMSKEGGIDARTQFGIVKNVQGEVGYEGVGFNVVDKNKERKAVQATHAFHIAAKYNYYSAPHMSFSTSGKIPLHIFDHIVRDIEVGMPFVFYNHLMAGCVLNDDFFTINMRPNVGVGINLNWWYGIQFYGNWWAEISSSFAKIVMENKDNQANWSKSAGFWKELPATLTVLYAINHYIDLSANTGFGNVWEGATSMKFGLGVTLRGGRLFG